MERTPTLLTFRQFAEKHSAFSQSSLRWARFREAENGFAEAFVSVGPRVLVWEQKFFRLIARKNGLDEGEFLDIIDQNGRSERRPGSRTS